MAADCGAHASALVRGGVFLDDFVVVDVFAHLDSFFYPFAEMLATLILIMPRRT
jgi:hypothetical protein